MYITICRNYNTSLSLHVNKYHLKIFPLAFLLRLLLLQFGFAGLQTADWRLPLPHKISYLHDWHLVINGQVMKPFNKLKEYPFDVIN